MSLLRIAELEQQLARSEKRINELRSVIAAQSGQHQANWYCINQSGKATLCADKADAFENAKLAQEMFPHNGPHWAVQTFKHQLTQPESTK